MRAGHNFHGVPERKTRMDYAKMLQPRGSVACLRVTSARQAFAGTIRRRAFNPRSAAR
jgi:hypothetical protein